jgi:Na+/pantothenate symporter
VFTSQLLCLFPSELVCWLSLFAACLTSTVFLLRSLAPLVMQETHKKQAAVLLGAIGYAPAMFARCILCKRYD